MPYDLDLSGRHLKPADLATALEAAKPGSLTSLSLAGNAEVADVLVDFLLASGHMAHLRDLDLSGVPMTDTAVASLVRTNEAQALSALWLGCWPIWKHGEPYPETPHPEVGNETLAVLADPAALPHLSVLVLHADWLDDGPLTAWVRSPGFRRLQALSLTAMVSATGLSALTPCLTGLDELVLNVFNLAGDQVLGELTQALRGAGAACTIRRLVSLSCGTDRNLIDLLDAGLPHLETLELPRLSLGPNGLARLQAGPFPPRLRQLVLSHLSAFATGETVAYADQGTVIDEEPVMAPLQAILSDRAQPWPFTVVPAPESAWPNCRPLAR